MLRYPLILLAVVAATGSTLGVEAPSLLQLLRDSPGRVILEDGSSASADVALVRKDEGAVSRWAVVNKGKAAVKIREVVLYDGDHGLPGDTPLHGEGFTKLSQTAGMLEKPVDLDTYTDRAHYKIPEPDRLRTVYSVVTLAPAGKQRLLLGFSSCRRFTGRFGFDGKRLRVSEDTENLTLEAGKTWMLEDFMAAAGEDREALYDGFTAAISKNHPRLKHDPVPTGWSSWICFGPGVTAKNVSDNSRWMKENLPGLRYVQIDDGYQPWMGDWLETGKAFGGGVQEVLKGIRKDGLEPALWVAPFVASPQSRLFKEHPEWFVTGDDGKPLPSNKIGFGGWRMGPWYALDGTHPGALKWLEETFRTLHRDWGVTYFKLDANYWGAIHGGHHHDPNATRVEAYRRGMEAILRGAGDSFILGCNHPLWPSLGLIHGSRASMDVAPSWKSFKDTGRENLYRNWQNGRLWWNDPDSLLLGTKSADVMGPDGKPVGKGGVTLDETLFHATLLRATGGMLLSGDNLPSLPPDRIALLQKSIPPTGRPFRFADESFALGRLQDAGREWVAVFNWDDQPADREVTFGGKAKLTDYWSGGDLGEHGGSFKLSAMPPHSGRLLEIVPVK
ncbi:alpha-galactosidase [Luteolibacter ambystomatis]|uniref:Alpha-galactosidase n=1 Tax=Luteolibacter ambystomatis TaxID=2824561 RepID=A0A975G601_9BACT|nr:glycoside hydrolase family 36 protein [Luteolibacter ambystomatis]QUE49418.1 alpha-galactosidase [Luteolibacter ambystomatis]